MPLTLPARRAAARFQNAVKLEENATHVRATLILPSGKKLTCVLPCHSADALAGALEDYEMSGLAGDGDDVELAGFMSKLKKAAKKVGKVALAPVKLAHKYTHQVGPIAAMHKKVQDYVAKALPITKPFIKVHNSLAAPVHKAIEGKKIKAKVTAKAIADVTKDLPIAQKGAAQAALVAEAKKAEALKSIGKQAARAQVLNAAMKAAKAGDKEAKALISRAKAGTTGTFKVTTPSGRVVNVPAAKVAHS